MAISQSDRQRYTDIFYSQAPQNGKLTGEQAKGIFMQSGLALPQLGEIWNLCDIDKDGCMDLDEFVLAMHFIFSLLNGSVRQIPSFLPPHLVPSSKSMHLPRAPPSIQHAPQTFSPSVRPSITSQRFDWHINSSDKTNYESLFNRFSRPGASTIHLQDVKGFLLEKGFSPNDLNTAWVLVDVGKTQSLSKEQYSLLLHILNSRSKGIPFPTNIPIHLSNRFLGKTAPISSASASSLCTGSFAVNQNRSMSSGPQYGSSAVQSQSSHTDNFYRTNSNGSLSLKHEHQKDNSNLSDFKEQPANGVEGFRNEIAIDSQSATKRNDPSISKAKLELEEFLSFLEKVERTASTHKSLLEASNPEFEELEKLAQEIKDKNTKMDSLLAQKKLELEELQSALNKKKYGL